MHPESTDHGDQGIENARDGNPGDRLHHHKWDPASTYVGTLLVAGNEAGHDCQQSDTP